MAQMYEAKLLWVKDVQHSMTQENEFEFHKRQFNIFEDEKGVWQCKGRLSNIEVPHAVKNPILLIKSHPFTTLLVWEAHERIFHNEILTEEVLDSSGLKTDKTAHPQMLRVQKAWGYFSTHHHLQYFLLLEWRKIWPLHIPALTLLDQFLSVVLMMSHRRLGFVPLLAM